jgi:peptide/nickel transport system permease protein
MLNYLIRRLLISAVTLVVISMVIFGILKIAPGDPLASFASNPNVPVEVRQRIRAQMGLDDPIPVQYAKWSTEYAQGNWGRSFLSRQPARDVIFERVPVTLKIVGTAYILSILIAIPIGVISAIKQYSAFDQISTTFAFLGFSLPTFFSGLVLIVIFSFKLDWFPFVYDDTTKGIWPDIKQSILPVTVLGLAGSATLTRFVRASMLEVISQDYVRTARAKGLREQSVVIFHAMRNAMIPVITIMALQIPEIFGGAIITEQIFRVPGIGSLLIESIESADHPVVLGIAMGVAVLVVLFNIIADIIYALLDPRIKLT